MLVAGEGDEAQFCKLHPHECHDWMGRDGFRCGQYSERTGWRTGLERDGIKVRTSPKKLVKGVYKNCSSGWSIPSQLTPRERGA